MASGLTPTYLFPYPLQTDSVDVAGDVEDLATAVETQMLLKAPLSSPTLTGTPTAPTAISDTNTTQIATTEYVINQGYLKSLTASTTYAPLDSAPLIGTPTAPTAALGTDSTQIATTEYVQNELANFVTLPTQTGNSGKFLTTDGTTAAWQTIQQSDVSGLTTAFSDLATVYSPLNISRVVSSTSRILILTDAAKLVEMSGGGFLTVPTNATVAYPIGTQIIVLQTGTSQVTLVGDTGVTVNATPGLKLRARWSSATLIKRAADTWVAFGDLVA